MLGDYFRGCLEWGKAKSRSPAQGELWELRPYDRSRCAEHGGSCNRTGLCPPHPGWSWSYHRCSCATFQGSKAKVAPNALVEKSENSSAKDGVKAVEARGVLVGGLRASPEDGRAVCDPGLALSRIAGWRMQRNLLDYRRSSPWEPPP